MQRHYWTLYMSSAHTHKHRGSSRYFNLPLEPIAFEFLPVSRRSQAPELQCIHPFQQSNAAIDMTQIQVVTIAPTYSLHIDINNFLFVRLQQFEARWQSSRAGNQANKATHYATCTFYMERVGPGTRYWYTARTAPTHVQMHIYIDPGSHAEKNIKL